MLVHPEITPPSNFYHFRDTTFDLIGEEFPIVFQPLAKPWLVRMSQYASDTIDYIVSNTFQPKSIKDRFRNDWFCWRGCSPPVSCLDRLNKKLESQRWFKVSLLQPLEMQTDCIRQPICTNQPTVEKCSQLNGTIKTDDRYRAKGSACGADLLRWSEAGSPYHLYGDEHFRDVEALFLLGGDHRALPEPAYKAEVAARFQAMEDALHDLDREGFFGDGPERFAVVINVVAPGEEDEDVIQARAARLNPAQSLVQLRHDLGA